MLEINVNAWGDWDELINYIGEMQSKGIKIKLVNTSALFELWYEEELQQMGFNKKEVV